MVDVITLCDQDLKTRHSCSSVKSGRNVTRQRPIIPSYFRDEEDKNSWMTTMPRFSLGSFSAGGDTTHFSSRSTLDGSPNAAKRGGGGYYVATERARPKSSWSPVGSRITSPGWRFCHSRWYEQVILRGIATGIHSRFLQLMWLVAGCEEGALSLCLKGNHLFSWHGPSVAFSSVLDWISLQQTSWWLAWHDTRHPPHPLRNRLRAQASTESFVTVMLFCRMSAKAPVELRGHMMRGAKIRFSFGFLVAGLGAAAWWFGYVKPKRQKYIDFYKWVHRLFSGSDCCEQSYYCPQIGLIKLHWYHRHGSRPVARFGTKVLEAAGISNSATCPPPPIRMTTTPTPNLPPVMNGVNFARCEFVLSNRCLPFVWYICLSLF